MLIELLILLLSIRIGLRLLHLLISLLLSNNTTIVVLLLQRLIIACIVSIAGLFIIVTTNSSSQPQTSLQLACILYNISLLIIHIIATFFLSTTIVVSLLALLNRHGNHISKFSL